MLLLINTKKLSVITNESNISFLVLETLVYTFFNLTDGDLQLILKSFLTDCRAVQVFQIL